MAGVYQVVRSNNKLDLIKLYKKDRNLFKKRGPHNQTILHLAARFASEEIMEVSLAPPITSFLVT